MGPRQSVGKREAACGLRPRAPPRTTHRPSGSTLLAAGKRQLHQPCSLHITQAAARQRISSTQTADTRRHCTWWTVSRSLGFSAIEPVIAKATKGFFEELRRKCEAEVKKKGKGAGRR